MDGVLGIIMAGFIFYAGYGIFKEVVNPLIGQQPDKKIINRIRKICSYIAGEDVSPHHFHIHQYGDHSELTFHIALDGAQSLSKAHSLADKMEKEINEVLSLEATIHIDPAGESETEKDIEEDEFN